MAKTGVTLPQVGAWLRDRSQYSGWSLCIGSGVSIPVFPDWPTLVRRLIDRDPLTKVAAAVAAENLIRSFSPDALIEAARDRFKVEPEEFVHILVEELYATARSELNDAEWKVFTNILCSRLADRNAKQWLAFLPIIQKHFGGVAALPLGHLIASVIESPLAPAAILSFNAEPLLPALINAYYRERYNMNASMTPKRGQQKQILDLVTHATSGRKTGRLPYYFCHGLLPVPAPDDQGHLPPSIDKLVFAESAYLQLATSTYSWQSSVFIDVCTASPVVFLGVSLTDSNMRRWLSSIHTNRIHELEYRTGKKGKVKFSGDSAVHYWINRAPATKVERAWTESLVAHLGVRIIWIDEWSEAAHMLYRLLGIRPP
jgi:hypothetical protein